MSLESSLEEERLKVLKVLHNHGVTNDLDNELDESTLKDLSLNDDEKKSGNGVTKSSDLSVESVLSPPSANAVSSVSSASSAQPFRPGHKHSVSLVLNDGDDDVEVAGVSKRDSPLRSNFIPSDTKPKQIPTTTSSRFTAESLFEPDSKGTPFDPSTSPKTSPKLSLKELHKEPHKETYKDLIFSTSRLDSVPKKIDAPRGRGRGRSRTDDYDSDDAAIDGLFDITEYKRSTRDPSHSGDHLLNERVSHSTHMSNLINNSLFDGSTFSNTINNAISTTITSTIPMVSTAGTASIVPSTVPSTVPSATPDAPSTAPSTTPSSSHHHLSPDSGRKRTTRSRSPVSRLPMDSDDEFYDETDEEYETDSNEEDEEESNEEEENGFGYDDIDSSETSEDESLTADDIKSRIESEEKPPGFKEGSALTGPVLSNSRRIRRPSELDAALVPTNTMSLLAAIEAEQKVVSSLTTTGGYRLRNDSASPHRAGSRGSSPGLVRMKSPNRGGGNRPIREQSPQQAEYAAYKRRIIHPNTAFDVAKAAAANGGNAYDIDVPYTSDHEEVRDAQRAAQLHMEISQIHSNTETRRMYRTMTRGNLPQLDEEESANSAPLKSFIVATDLSPEATHALEWTIGTVLRDGNLLIIVCAFEEDGPTDPQSEELTRLDAMDKITASTVKLLKKTRLQVHIAIEVLHCKSARHALTDITDHVSPTLVILGSRGRSALKGVLLGSFSNYIVERSSVPVMVARRKLQKAKNKGLNVRLANNLRHGTLSTAKID